MNSNAFHNIANIANVLLAMLLAGILATGCVQDTLTQAISCSKSWLDPMWTVWGLGAVNVLKIAVNVTRDGLGGLFKAQPPVQ